jgi:hypothetical protein
MPWTTNRWPPHPGDAIDTETVMNEVRAALAERDALVQALRVPPVFSRWGPLRGTPKGGTGSPNRTVANLQYEIQEMLTLAWPLRWWDGGRETLYTLDHLCQDAFGRNVWTHDLTATDSHGDPANRWAPAYALLFEELYRSINRLDRVRILPTTSESRRRDSVYRLTFGISDWAAERAAGFGQFDGEDDGAAVDLAYDVGIGASVFEDGGTEEWALESREYRLTFDTAALGGCAVRNARLDFTTAAPEGSADFSDSFTAEVVDGAGQSRGTFASGSTGPKQIALPAESVNGAGDTVLTIRSTRADSADRAAWAPAGPDYTSTYREGIAVMGPVRLIVEVDFEYRQ